MKNLTLLRCYENSEANYIPSRRVLQVKFLDHLPINGKSAYEVSGKQTLESFSPTELERNQFCIHLPVL